MKRTLPTLECAACGGRGEVPDREAGAVLKHEREERELTRKQVAPFFYSETYMCDLERGLRPLTWELVDKYRAALEAASKHRIERQLEEKIHA